MLFALVNQGPVKFFILKTGGTFLYGTLYIFRALLALHAAYCATKWMYFSLVKNENAQQSNFKLLAFTVLIFGFIGEAIFMFVPQAQGNTQFGFATIPWTIYYEKLRNEKRYRDENMEGRINNGKKKVFFLGDSFTYGNGIKDPDDRFTNIVTKEISDKYEVFNLGKGNSDTRDEFVRLMQYGVVPDVLVLQYYYNDIDPTAQRLLPKENPSGIGVTLFKTCVMVSQTSFFLNFIEINIAKFTPPFQSKGFKKNMSDAYHDAACRKAHLADMQCILDYCKLNKVKLYVLMIPDMREPSFTEKDCYPVITDYLNSNNIPVISIYDAVKDKPASELVVSGLDAHANEAVQKIIAGKLLQNVSEFKK
ncbi:MAG: hypothetical protein ACXVDP_13230 [Bacteroidia bacterium]